MVLPADDEGVQVARDADARGGPPGVDARPAWQGQALLTGIIVGLLVWLVGASTAVAVVVAVIAGAARGMVARSSQRRHRSGRPHP